MNVVVSNKKDAIARSLGNSLFQLLRWLKHSRRHETLWDHAMVAFIRSLKQNYGGIKVYAMSNISREDFAALSTALDWSLFDQVFTSGHVGMRKPDHGFYRHVLQRTELAPVETIFVDDKQENVAAAKSLGMNSIIFDNATAVLQTLDAVLQDQRLESWSMATHQ